MAQIHIPLNIRRLLPNEVTLRDILNDNFDNICTALEQINDRLTRLEERSDSQQELTRAVAHVRFEGKGSKIDEITRPDQPIA